MNDEPIGKGATTLDWLRSQYPWLAELLDRKDNALRKIAALRDSEADEPLDDAIAIAERALAQSATPAPAAVDARVERVLHIIETHAGWQDEANSRQAAEALVAIIAAALPPSPAPLPATIEVRAAEYAVKFDCGEWILNDDADGLDDDGRNFLARLFTEAMTETHASAAAPLPATEDIAGDLFFIPYERKDGSWDMGGPFLDRAEAEKYRARDYKHVSAGVVRARARDVANTLSALRAAGKPEDGG